MDRGRPPPRSGGAAVPADRLRRSVAVTPIGVAVPPARDAGPLARLRPAGGRDRDGLPSGPSRRLGRGGCHHPPTPRPPHTHVRIGHPGPHDNGRVLPRCLDSKHEPPAGVTGGRRPPLCHGPQAFNASTGRLAAKANQRRATEGRLAAILEGSRPMAKRRILRSAATGAWLSTRSSLLNGSDLSAEEFRDGVRLRLGLTPTSLPPRCDGCGERFTTEHAMSCRKGGLILHCHNDLVATWGQLCGQAHTPSTVSDEPLIRPSQDVQAAGANRTEPTPEFRDDIAVHGFWTRGTTAIFDVRVTDTDAPSNRNTAPAKVLQRHEAEKKDKYGALCIARRRTFTPLVFSVDGMQGVEATAASRWLASSLASKWRRSYSEECVFVRSRLSIALVRSASRCLRADRNPMRRTSLPDMGLRHRPRPLPDVTVFPHCPFPLAARRIPMELWRLPRNLDFIASTGAPLRGAYCSDIPGSFATVSLHTSR